MKTATLPFPKDWCFDVVHDHTLDPPCWVGVLYHRPKGGRYPQEAKDVRETQNQNRKHALDKKRQSKIGMPADKNVGLA